MNCCNTVCCRFFQPKQKIPKGLSIFLSKVAIGDLESVEKIIPQQCPLGVTSQAAPADTAIWADWLVLTGWQLLKGTVKGWFFQLILNLLWTLYSGKLTNLLVFFVWVNKLYSTLWQGDVSQLAMVIYYLRFTNTFWSLYILEKCLLYKKCSFFHIFLRENFFWDSRVSQKVARVM